jgi:16S rRNA (cytosine967-C5)-methyltransferase
VSIVFGASRDRVRVSRRTGPVRDLKRVRDQKRLGGHHGLADLLLLDVPCSNTGVLGRRVEAKYRFGAEALAALIDLQRQIVADSIPMLADAGALLYATCSIEEEENASQAQWIARWHRMRLVKAALSLPSGLPGQAASRYADGGFFALLQRAEG